MKMLLSKIFFTLSDGAVDGVDSDEADCFTKR